MSRGGNNITLLANRYIKKSKQVETVVVEKGGLDDIINVIISADGQAAPFMTDFAPLLKNGGDYKTLKNIWRFTRKHIQYVPDRTGH
ncbi:MAG: hypothetical protein AAFU67_19430, partial [Bacteroidota bacterium]